MRTRPFRHLCPEADKRDAMTDDDFWEYVTNNLQPEDEYDPPEIDPQVYREPCQVCGSVTHCAVDSEGRALIHVEEEEEDDNKETI